MTFFILFLGNLVKGVRDGNGGGGPLKQYNSKDIGYNIWAQAYLNIRSSPDSYHHWIFDLLLPRREIMFEMSINHPNVSTP
jgi:hypothetical protein